MHSHDCNTWHANIGARVQGLPVAEDIVASLVGDGPESGTQPGADARGLVAEVDHVPGLHVMQFTSTCQNRTAGYRVHYCICAGVAVRGREHAA